MKTLRNIFWLAAGTAQVPSWWLHSIFFILVHCCGLLGYYGEIINSAWSFPTAPHHNVCLEKGLKSMPSITFLLWPQRHRPREQWVIPWRPQFAREKCAFGWVKLVAKRYVVLHQKHSCDCFEHQQVVAVPCSWPVVYDNLPASSGSHLPTGQEILNDWI